MSSSEAHLHSPVLLACRALARAMDEFDEAAGDALGLGRSDLRALNLLEHGPLSPSTLARRLGLTRPAVTALISRLEDAGHVARVPVPGDRRAAAVELRPATWQALAGIYRPVGERIGRLDAELDDTGRDALLRALSDIVASFDAVRPGLTGSETPDESGRVVP
jgi:DNA-binding MarR family transcriptional regulator